MRRAAYQHPALCHRAPDRRRERGKAKHLNEGLGDDQGSAQVTAKPTWLSFTASRSMMVSVGGTIIRCGLALSAPGRWGPPSRVCLIRAGHSLSVYDRRPEATATLCAQGAVRTDSAFAAARDSEVVFTSLPGPAEFEAAMLEPQTGILAGLRPGTAHIDLTTNAPKTIARVAEAVGRVGVELIDAPVSGRPPTMTVMVGASDSAFAKYRPLFEAIAANVFHVGPSGAGATAKLVTQYLGYTNFIASIEGMLVAAKAGIDLDTLARIVPVSAGQSRTFDNIAAWRVSRHIRRRRHARHRRQGYRARVPARP